ncbi:2'-5' RNA ligase family protein [Mucilaginibacter robiniae]|uniref:2'-5' RNA ligase family protein n=1 Tax=Mucilaginibacter robiniae TaxID=2728022 RepID=A0A7L5DVM2_9SPHI|nr:2'-5' RNA ligase family protein [Mucilaginibacter robiniae]QJD95140.1 2'-5' RNA ligase family protein [Mucilaginibacter robiniae]
MQTQAHLTIHEFSRKNPGHIQEFVQQLYPKINNMPPITFQIDNFSSFKHGEESRTLYAAIKPTYKTDNWLALFKQHLNVGEVITPHVTVAKNISIDQFLLLWPIFTNELFQEKFIADRLMILERESLKPDCKWKIYRELYFRKNV